MWVKICANTNLEDAKLAAELGADAVGFVFAPSKRLVNADQVAAIVAELPDFLEKIGVFGARDAAQIGGIVRASGLTGVQLHGGFDLELARQLREELGEAFSITQTIHWQTDDESGNAAEVAAKLDAISHESTIDRVLVDSKSAKGVGGTGISFNWNTARNTLASFQGKLIVAGGMRPGNAADAISLLRPWGVDVASGVEDFPGKKDPLKLRQFIQNAKAMR
jgi:phosphoribosylanthranilate isomerase